MDSSETNPIKIPAIIIAIVLALWGLLGWIASGQEEPGPFGDMFGFSNSLFSGLAFAGIIYTIYLQRQELRLQREELRLQRDELKKSVEAQQDSAVALDKQVKLAAVAAKINALSTLLGEAQQRLVAVKASKLQMAASGASGLIPASVRAQLVEFDKEVNAAKAHIEKLKTELTDLTHSLNL